METMTAERVAQFADEMRKYINVLDGIGPQVYALEFIRSLVRRAQLGVMPAEDAVAEMADLLAAVDRLNAERRAR